MLSDAGRLPFTSVARRFRSCRCSSRTSVFVSRELFPSKNTSSGWFSFICACSRTHTDSRTRSARVDVRRNVPERSQQYRLFFHHVRSRSLALQLRRMNYFASTFAKLFPEMYCSAGLFFRHARRIRTSARTPTASLHTSKKVSRRSQLSHSSTRLRRSSHRSFGRVALVKSSPDRSGCPG